MTKNEAVFIWIALWLYGFAFTAYLYGAVFSREKGVKIGWYLTVLAFIPQTISMGIRWNATGHPPVMREFEMATLGTWLTLIVFGVLRQWQKKIDVVGVAVLPIIILMLGKGLMTNPYLEPMAPPFKSNWLVLHIFFAWIAYGAFLIGAGLGILYLLKERGELRGRVSDFLARLPGLPVMNDLMLKVIIFGFVALSVQIGAGSLWAYGLWGRYWAWDPVETWSLITWLIYATYIHLAVTLGWKGKKMAWLAILSLFSLFITYGGIGYMTSVHMPMM